jgi:hypothetical protein
MATSVACGGEQAVKFEAIQDVRIPGLGRPSKDMNFRLWPFAAVAQASQKKAFF